VKHSGWEIGTKAKRPNNVREYENDAKIRPDRGLEQALFYNSVWINVGSLWNPERVVGFSSYYGKIALAEFI